MNFHPNSSNVQHLRVTFCLCRPVEVSLPSSLMRSVWEVGLHFILSSSCLWRLSAIIWIASVHFSLKYAAPMNKNEFLKNGIQGLFYFIELHVHMFCYNCLK
ncbi:UNVERIFIED_CONTAM: hypothetical protein FKN15_062647 [Acipenser sinensis]